MDLVLTLIADSAPVGLLDEATAAAKAALIANGNRISGARLLAQKMACDIFFDAQDPPATIVRVGAQLHRFPVDTVVQRSAERRKRLLVIDMESTLIENEMLDELSSLLGVPEIHERVCTLTARAMGGEIDFKQAFRERVATLAGRSVSLLQAALPRIAFVHGARLLVQTMRANGAFTVMVTGGFPPITSYVAECLGIDAVVSNILEIQNGLITGQVLEPILDGEGKRDSLVRFARERGVPSTETLAVGDGANDLPMIQAAGLGVAFRAKPHVAARAPARIDHGDLTALLFMQGYTADEFRV